MIHISYLITNELKFLFYNTDIAYVEKLCSVTSETAPNAQYILMNIYMVFICTLRFWNVQTRSRIIRHRLSILIIAARYVVTVQNGVLEAITSNLKGLIDNYYNKREESALRPNS